MKLINKFINSHNDCTDFDHQTETEKENYGKLVETEKIVNEILSNIEKDKYQQESEMRVKGNEKISEIEMNENQKHSEAERDEIEKPAAAASRKVNFRVRKSARLASQLFSDLGSVVKTERVNGVKLVLRKSARLESSRKRKIKDDGDDAEKRQKRK